MEKEELGKNIYLHLKISKITNRFAFNICTNIYNQATDNLSPNPITLGGLIQDLTDRQQAIEEEIDLGEHEEENIPVKDKFTEIVENTLIDFQDLVVEMEENIQEAKKYFDIIEHCFEKVLKYTPTDRDVLNGRTDRRLSAYWGDLKRNTLNGRSLTKILKTERRLSRIIERTEDDLGLGRGSISNINNIRNGKTLQELRNDSDNLTNIQARINATGKTLDELIAGGGAIPNCPHTDYDNLKDQKTTLNQEKQILQSERDVALKEKHTALSEKETQIQSILKKLNTSLNLNLKDPTLDNIITKIKALLKDPKIVEIVQEDTSQIESLQAHNQQLQQTVDSLQTQLSQVQENKENTATAIPAPVNEEVTKENKEAVLQVLKESNSPIYEEEIKQIQQAQSAKQLMKSYQKVIDKGNINLQAIKVEKTELVQHQKTERIILISLLAISLVSVGGLLMKLRKKQTSN